MLNTAYPDNTYNPQTTEQQHTVEELRDMQKLNQQTNSWLNETTDKNSYLDPQTLNPQTATLEDIRIHAREEQDLSPTTIEKRLRYLHYIETHPYPIDLRNPTETECIRHLRYRLYHEKPPATNHALRHEKLALNMLRQAYGLPPITYKLPRHIPNKKMIIPLPDTVRELWHHKYSKNKYTNKLYQYIFRTSFLLGIRMPSELTNLTTDDIYYNRNGTAVITITEAKKRNSQRTLILPTWIATDKRHKTLQNWTDSWRPQKENRYSDNHLFIQPNGKPFTPAHLAKNLRHYGKQVWGPYHPYCSRHWSAVARLIEEYHTHHHWNVYTVQNWHGHSSIKSTEQYIKHAEQYYQIQPFSWIQHVLKRPTHLPQNKAGGKHAEINKRPENPCFEWNSSERGVWARRHPYPTTDTKSSTEIEIHSVLIVQPNSLIGEGPQNNVGFFTFSFEQHNCPLCDDEPVFLDLPPIFCLYGSSSPTITVTKYGGNWFGDQVISIPVSSPAPPNPYNFSVTGNNMEYGSVTGQTSFLLAVVPFIDHTPPFIMNHQDSTDILFSLPSNIFEDILPGGSPPYLDSTWDQMPSEGNVLTQNGSYLGTDPSKPSQLYHGDLQPQNNIVYPRKYCIQFFLKDNCGWTHKDSVADGNQKGIPDQLFLNGGSCISPIVGFDWYPHNLYICCTEGDNRDNIQHCMSQNYLNSERQNSELHAIKNSMYVMLCYVISYLVSSSYICCSLVVYKCFDITYCMLCYLRRDF